jgi:hypothetical protein
MSKRKPAAVEPRDPNRVFCTQIVWARDTVGNLPLIGGSRPRLTSGDMVCVQAPDRARWEIYTSTDGLEVFKRYANEAEVTHLNSACTAEPEPDGTIRMFLHFGG